MNSERDDAIIDRLRECVRIAGSGNALAQKASINRRTLEYYLSGTTEPKLSALKQIAAAVGVDFAWLATGVGGPHGAGAAPTPAPQGAIDPELMGRATDKILRTYKELGISIPPIDVGRLAAKWYDLVTRSIDDPAERPGALTMLAAQLKAELSAPVTPDTASKRRA